MPLSVCLKYGLSLCLYFCILALTIPDSVCVAQEPGLKTEKLEGTGFWVSAPEIANSRLRSPIVVKVWFEDQFLGDGQAYQRRAKTFAGAKRTELRNQVVAALKQISDQSYQAAQEELQTLTENGTIQDVERHWIINGFTCAIAPQDVPKLATVPGVRKVFVAGRERAARPGAQQEPFALVDNELAFEPERYEHPWYTTALKADEVWKTFGLAGNGTLNVIHDSNFILSPQLASNIYRNPNEIPDNNLDDDNNGLIDDVHGFNFATHSNLLTIRADDTSKRNLHGTSCASIVCGQGTKEFPLELGIAPGGQWAGVIANTNLESAVEWAIEQNADTYSMSFSHPRLGELRSHWRKIFEHGSFCGVYFVSGAGNFAQTTRVPVQMRTPEDVPNVVFAAAGVQRDLSRTPFSSKGPVEWDTEHYKDGRVQKPEVCAFNFELPMMMPNGTVQQKAINGNSFAGPMFCGSIALMLSADPDLLPWDLKEIITTTATDVGPEGFDHETGHGLINCFGAVKEVLRRKAIRDQAISD